MNYREHILVVDDDPALLEQAESILADQYQVSLATSGQQAVEHLQKGLWADLILLDILMPEMDGYQTLEAIRSMEKFRSTPVIFLTSLNDETDELQGLSMGATDYITKPFSPLVLSARVELRLNSGVQLDRRKLEALPEPLTPVELNVARLLAKAYSNDEISHELHYSLDTIKKMVSHVLEKLDLKNRREIRKYLR